MDGYRLTHNCGGISGRNGPSIVAVLTTAVLFSATGALGQTKAPSEPAEETGLVSLLDVAPSIYWGFKRYPKYYGDPNMNSETVDGPLLQRQYLLGSIGGFRDMAARNGLTLDLGVTQVVQGVASGPGDGAYAGSADLWASLDTARAGLWSGGMINAHLEGNWGDTVRGTGALLPFNGDSIMPAQPSSFALSELYLVQALPNNFSLIAGKINFGDNADKSPFANDEEAISKMSYLWAHWLEEHGVAQMASKGRLQVGADADITVFDPDTVTDNSTLEIGKNALPTTGIPYVIVNGTVVVDDSVVQRVFPGKPIRNPIIE